MEKSELRNNLKRSREGFVQGHKADLPAKHLQLMNKLRRLANDLGEGPIWSYMHRGDEAPAHGWSTSLAFPKVVGDCLEFFQPASASDFVTSSWNIQEPGPKSQPASAPKLILIPGLGFDRQGGRLGYGRGFYDRLLEKFSSAVRVGVAYSVQISQHLLPLEAHDQRMDWIVTENFILKCEKKD